MVVVDDSSTRNEPSFAHDKDDSFHDENGSVDDLDHDDDRVDSSQSSSGLTRTSQGPSGGNKDSSEDDTPQLIGSRETQAVFATKFLVALVLFASAGILGYFAFKLTKDEEEETFRAKVRNRSSVYVCSRRAGDSYESIQTNPCLFPRFSFSIMRMKSRDPVPPTLAIPISSWNPSVGR